MSYTALDQAKVQFLWEETNDWCDLTGWLDFKIALVIYEVLEYCYFSSPHRLVYRQSFIENEWPNYNPSARNTGGFVTIA